VQAPVRWCYSQRASSWRARPAGAGPAVRLRWTGVAEATSQGAVAAAGAKVRCISAWRPSAAVPRW